MLCTDVGWLLRCLVPQPTFRPGEFENVDIDRFLYVLDCHRLTNVVYQHTQNALGFPSAFRERLKAKYVQNTFRQLGFVSELCRVLKQLREHRIEVIALKGPILSQLYYGDCTLRQCKDLDILVRPADLQATYEVLTDSGYELSEVLWNSPKQETIYRKTFHHYDLYHAGRAVQLELHWRLNATGNDSRTLWVNSVKHSIGGLPVRILSPADTFIYLCQHGATHQWKRLFWLLDIARMIGQEGSDFLLRTYQRAVEQGLERYVLSGCQLAHVLLGVQLPDRLHEAIRQDKTTEKLLETSIFWINSVSERYANPIESAKTFKSSIGRFITAHRSVFYLEGYAGIYTVLRDFFINPAYWNTYSFSDRFFALNYVAAPFLWIHSIFNKGKE